MGASHSNGGMGVLLPIVRSATEAMPGAVALLETGMTVYPGTVAVITLLCCFEMRALVTRIFFSAFVAAKRSA